MRITITCGVAVITMESADTTPAAIEAELHRHRTDVRRRAARRVRGALAAAVDADLLDVEFADWVVEYLDEHAGGQP